MRKYLLPVLAVVGVLFSIYSVVLGNKPVPTAEPIAQPSPAPFRAYIAGAGIIEASTQNIAIGSALSGIVSQIHVKVGSQVKTGNPLFKIDDRNYKAQLAVQLAAQRTAQAAVKESESSLADVQSQLALAESVTDKRAISIEEVNKRRFAVQTNEAKLESARAQVLSTQAQVKATETDIERLMVRAPVDGEILQINIRLGEYAAAGVLQTPLVLLGNLDRLHVRVDIDENDAWRFQRNSQAAAFVRGNHKLKTYLQFERIEPYVVPKRSLTGDSTERVDTRVMQVIYSFDRGNLPVYAGQQIDVFIEVPAVPAVAAAEERSRAQQTRPSSGNGASHRKEKK
jgi:HlyD family secretion protein